MRLSALLALVSFACVMAVSSPYVSAGPMENPFGTFNVYSLGSIGSSSSPYGSDYQGVVGAGKNVYFGGFSLDAADAKDGVGMYVGGSVNLTGGTYSKDILASGNVSLSSMTVNGSIYSGGDVTNTKGGGMVNGNISAAGKISISKRLTVNGKQFPGTPYESPVDFAAVNDYFLDTSANIGGMDQTTVIKNQYGNLVLSGKSGVNVVNVDSKTLKDAWGVTITAPSDAIFYINVLDSNIVLDSTVWSYNGGIAAGDVLLNMPTATSLMLSSANAVNILAPLAATNFSSGVVTGNLIVGDLQGSGQVNLGHFTHGQAVPEPATMAFLALGGLGIILRRRRFTA